MIKTCQHENHSTQPERMGEVMCDGARVGALGFGETARASSVACGGVGSGIDAAAVPGIAEGVGPAGTVAGEQG